MALATFDPKLVIFHEITEADVRKINAVSNDSPTGGGARDIRFNFNQFDGVFQEMLPDSRMVNLRRKGVRRLEPVHFGNATFQQRDKPPITSEIAWYTPTDKRPREGRLPRVHKIPALTVPPSKGLGIPMLLIQQATNRSIFLSYAYESQFNQWIKPIEDILSRSLKVRVGTQAGSGYIDLKDGREYVHVRVK